MPLIETNLMDESCAPLHAMKGMERESRRPAGWPTIEEICSGEWSIGGPNVISNDVCLKGK